MADIWSKTKRSAVMALIRSHGNKDTELRMMELFREHGLTGWRRRQDLVGKPDFVFRRERVVVFVDGCFWHRCGKHCRIPGTRREWWEAKLERNVRRDALVTRGLRKEGWKVVRVWEHDLAVRRWGVVAGRVRRALGR